MLFDQLRESFRSAFDVARPPAERRAVAAEMKAALVQARLGVDDLRRGVETARARAAAARAELETTRRRGRLARDVGDAETVQVAERFAATQAERAEVLDAKADAQARELALAERELAEMTAEFKRLAATGVGGAAGVPSPEARAAAEVDAALGGDDALRAELDALGRRGGAAPADREADAAARLAALKRRMGK
jgi:hypothetical protein